MSGCRWRAIWSSSGWVCSGSTIWTCSGRVDDIGKLELFGLAVVEPSGLALRVDVVGELFGLADGLAGGY